MSLVKIQLTSNVLINGENASPTDKNKGVYELEKHIAYNLIDRKRAVLFGEEVEIPKPPANNNPEYDLDALKALADKLNIKYNPQIGGKKLNEKILIELKPKAEELKANIKDLDALKAFELISKTEEQGKGDQGEDVVDEITAEELKEIAQEAEIDVPEDATEEELKTLIKEALEDYASECKLEAVENETIKATWERIKAKLNENDN